MKHIYHTLLSACFIFLISFTTILNAQNVGINATGNAPNASAGLDIDFSDKGILIPRVALTALNSASPVSSPTVSLLVYNTATAGSSPNNVLPGYYYWNGTVWVAVGGTGSRNWGLLGNAGTTAGTNFLGTTDAQDLVFKVNGTEKMRLLTTGNVGIGTSSPDFDGSGALTTYLTVDGTNNGTGGMASIGVGSNKTILSTVGQYGFFNTRSGGGFISAIVGATDGNELNSGSITFKTSSSGTMAPAMIINKYGYVGIGTGTVTPYNLLEVKGGIAIGSSYTGTVAPTNGAIIQGNVGLGVTSPRTKLHVASTGNTLANLKSTVANNGITISSNYTAGADYAPGIVWSSEDNNPTINKAAITSRFTSSGSYLHFGTSSNYSSGVNNDAIVIDYSGNVGLGSSAPIIFSGSGNYLSVDGTNNAGNYAYIGVGSNKADNQAVGEYSFFNTRTSTTKIASIVSTSYGGSPYSSKLTFNTSLNNTLSPAMIIDQYGYVGIGSSTAPQRLTVQSTTAIQLRLGESTGTHYYDIGRENSVDGYLQFTGSQGFPYTGYRYNGPTQIYTDATQLELFNAARSISYKISRNTTTGYLDHTGSQAGFTGYTFNAASGTAVVGVNCTSPQYALHVVGDIASSATVRTTNALATGAITACSDIRYKRDVTALPNALETVKQLKGVNYYWKTEEFASKHFSSNKQIGFIAQEVEKLIPELVLTDVDGYKSVDYSKFTPILVEAIKEQQQMIEALKATVHNQQQTIEKQQGESKNLKTDMQELKAEIETIKSLIKNDPLVKGQ